MSSTVGPNGSQVERCGPTAYALVRGRTPLALGSVGNEDVTRPLPNEGKHWLLLVEGWDRVVHGGPYGVNSKRVRLLGVVHCCVPRLMVSLLVSCVAA